MSFWSRIFGKKEKQPQQAPEQPQKQEPIQTQLQAPVQPTQQSQQQTKIIQYVIRLTDHHGIEYLNARDMSTVADPAMATIFDEDRANFTISIASSLVEAPSTKIDYITLDKAIIDFRASRVLNGGSVFR